MNILIASSGRRTKLVEYFINEFSNDGKVIVTDCDYLAPTMNIGAKGYVVPRITDENYIKEIIKICELEKVDAIISLIDPELSLLAKNKLKFEEIGVKVLVSDYEITELCFDKMNMFRFLEKNNFKCAKTYCNIKDFKADIESNRVKFPVFVKPRTGSASLGINKIENLKHLEILFELSNDLIIQEFLEGQELGIDVYTDFISKEIISIFAKKKIRMRSGETDKAVSVKNEKLFKLIELFVNKLGTLGPIDIDVFEVNGEYYISEVNPRFGGGHLLAYECGDNYPRYIKNNLNNIKNISNIGNYRENVYMIKHDTLNILEGEVI
ncbi:ATP-grasp domain-containing protein [Paeniclostridium sordellii]|uniref:ATP-grasp domain-containing protein n=1 Tax=Paraclostridium sordellii TaxID=1505 RepID=UPI002149D9F8|nr:ATP-grasp domain-containing protein [Paeniclostridium sordellii]MCR1849924.1 ATP-grasp domain-containing protein [Paeniclostridium sordellii]